MSTPVSTRSTPPGAPWPIGRLCAKPETRARSHIHTIPCTAAVPIPSLQSSAGLQLAQIAANGTAAEKALLAELKPKSPDASYIELLRLLKVRRRSWALLALVVAAGCGAALRAHICRSRHTRPRTWCTHLHQHCAALTH